MQKYELYVDNYQDDEGDDCYSVEHIKDDSGDWCKADDVDKMQVDHSKEMILVRAANERAMADNKVLQFHVYILKSKIDALLLEQE